MRAINPRAVLLVGACTVGGALLGATLIGLAVGVGLVLVATILHD